ncbi:MAG TPA: CfrBI family restriction endonuclease, partial [Ktedonobacteraceae bacterium]|nr:CfrBI family restriction endonuclease [Ktedonobacteraceae bacterium]
MPKKASKQDPNDQLTDLLGTDAFKLLSGSGVDLIQQVGFDVIRGIIFDILTGKNLRDSTEVLTRSRIAALNIALTSFFLKGASQSQDFVSNLPSLASNILTRKRLPKSERWLANWLLGLTSKSVQNVLRDNPNLIESYRQRYVETCNEIIAKNKQTYGELTGTLTLGTEVEAQVDWLLILYLLNTIGAQTLTIRGSEKSSYGKLFEKLVLGSLLSILGFKYEPNKSVRKGTFWLSTQDEKRESDATLLYNIGQGVRFDIGFIGRGNSEISLDKVSRFQRHEEIQGTSWYMATFIIVDRLGRDSKVAKLAKNVGGDII